MTTYVDHTNAGKDVEITDDTKAKWLLDQGYISRKTASKAKDADERGRYATSPPASDDPTLAENRERPTPPEKIKPHVANSDDTGTSGETTHGKDMGLDADVRPGAPKVKVTTTKDAGTLPETDPGASLKAEIDKEQEKVTPGQA